MGLDKVKIIQIAVGPDDYMAICRAASLAGLKPTSWVREMVARALEGVENGDQNPN